MNDLALESPAQFAHAHRLVNLPRLRQVLAAEGVAAIVATSPENVTYASGYWALSQWIRRGPQTYVLLPAEDPENACLVFASSLLDLLADQPVWVTDVRRFGYFRFDRAEGRLDPLSARQVALDDLPVEDDALSALVAAIRARGLASARIAVDELGLMPGQWEALQALLPDAHLVPAMRLFRGIRAVKTPEEIARLRQAAQITERSIAAALDIARPGITEIEMARAFHAQTVAEDGTPVLGCIGFGVRSAMPNVQPSDTPLAEGDIIRFDAGGRYRHYRADIARIATLGQAPERVRRYHHALHRGVDAALEAIRPGVRASRIFEIAVETVRREGIPHYERSHVGHGIGLDGYDLPDLTAASQDVIEEGMVMCVETPYYELGWGGLQVEDTVVVRAHGIETFMTTSGALVEIGT
ncbi:Xaa-Pro peptidase family protein [Luteimonas sp. XNQY3]|nr:Xaa-Pro peptidase family protein [Luteimonas sp. XNQY3]MCD9007831.1 Xaa-Pro peptidase family protein [Luteimonas sp. XNQY3]